MALTRKDLARMARAQKTKNRATAPRRKAKRKRKPHVHAVSKRRFLRALRGTGGVKRRIAGRLGATPECVRQLLLRPGWDDIREAYEEERDQVIDLAEDTIIYAITNRADMAEATRNARWYLERKARHLGYGDKVQIEGGENPIRIASIVAVDSLNLPLDMRRRLLRAIETQDGSDDVLRLADPDPSLPSPTTDAKETPQADG